MKKSPKKLLACSAIPHESYLAVDFKDKISAPTKLSDDSRCSCQDAIDRDQMAKCSPSTSSFFDGFLPPAQNLPGA